VKMLRAIWDELIGLFVDDWRFALLLVAWVGVGKLMALHATGAAGPVFFAGLATILLAFVYVRAAVR